jgi:N-formylglutamate amidohydrolase
MVRYDKSRFYCDVERLMNDPMEKIGQGIIYKEFEGFKREVSSSLYDKLMGDYHLHRQRLSFNITSDRVLLIDCHSFPSDLSDIDICIGFNSDWSMDIDVVNFLVNKFKEQGYKVGINAPYSNSITPSSDFEYTSVMIEVNKRVYMDEDSLLIKPTQFTKLKRLLNDIYLSLLGKS